ncbi:type I-E CRISPR-associated protein Cse1/CasA [Streptococcus pluranimalium]|uniref:type I-E CRISPR-associated protein Cse1/CasA n=1 Tax=Streptococcus pluranimalium TaxID=82348 RepID=UPI003F666F86
MSRFNLLDEPWIAVVYDDKGHTKEISLLDLFQNAHRYKDLAGDTKTQDFAVLRVLLAILHTVFSRFDADGEVYEWLEVDERFRQLEAVDESDLEEYENALFETWLALWQTGQFPEIVTQYLEKWRDRFYLFDEAYPFFQVRKEDIAADKIVQSKATAVSGKNINRTISESNNKTALFSPRSEKNKELLNGQEIVRWLLTFQGYTGVGDKTKFKKLDSDVTLSKGWLFDLGGMIAKGHNLFETLLLNCYLVQNESDNLLHVQTPCWELSSQALLNNYLGNSDVDNLAALYTVWSRGIYIDPSSDLAQPFTFEIVKLPEVKHQDNFLEPMTLWEYRQSGVYKDHHIPRKHVLNQSLWRSFGLLASSGDKQRKPGLLDWLTLLRKEIGNHRIILSAVSMQDDGNATSWVPTDEIIDSLAINEFVLTDLNELGWVPRIDDTVEETKTVISKTYKQYVDDIREIRNVKSNDFTAQKVEELYFKIDQPFRQWLAGIQITDEKDETIRQWRKCLKKMVRQEAEQLLQSGNLRDYLGIVDSDKGTVKNITTAYEKFNYWLHQNLK